MYAQPVKHPSFIRYAAQRNVSLMTFDNEEELYKIKKLFSEAKLVLRILVDDSYSAIPLGTKYGAPLHTTKGLLQLAKGLNLNVIGVRFVWTKKWSASNDNLGGWKKIRSWYSCLNSHSYITFSFHVGSECSNANAFYHAVVHARYAFDQAEKIGFELELLDVGGGFNDSGIVDGAATFEKIAAVLAPAVDEMFPSKNVRVIAEPGRYYVGGPAYTFCVGIIGRRINSQTNSSDGMNDHQKEYKRKYSCG